MEEFCPGNERTSMNYHNQRKRTNSVLRECGEGSGVTSGGHECKKIKGLVSHELIHSLTDRKASTSYTNDKAYARRQHRVGFDGRGAMRQKHDGRVRGKVTSAYMHKHKLSSAILFTGPPSDDDDDDDGDDEVVRDGPGEEGKKAKQQKVPTASNCLQLTDQSHSRIKLMPFSNELAEGRHTTTHHGVAGHQSCYAQDWEGSDNEYYHQGGCVMASNQLCIAKPEGSLMQSNNPQDGYSKCFRSPTHSQSGSSNMKQSSEMLIFKGSQQETERNTSFPATFCYPVRLEGSRMFYRVEGTMQWMTSDNTSVTGMSNAAVLRQDPLSSSSQTSSDNLSEVSIHSRESEPRTNFARTQPEGPDESFYSVGSHHKADHQPRVLLKTRSTTNTYKSRSEGPDNRYVPDLL